MERARSGRAEPTQGKYFYRDLKEGEEKQPAANFSMNKTMIALSKVFNVSENIMQDTLAAKMVIDIENGTKELKIALDLFPNATNVTAANITALKLKIALTQLSVQHSFARLREQEIVHELIANLGSITIFITTGFVILASLFVVVLLYRGFKTKKPGYGVYDLDQKFEGNQRTRGRNGIEKECGFRQT